MLSLIFFIFTVPRENEPNNFGRHINLQLTYSFQQNGPHGPIHLGNNNNNNNTSKTSLFAPHGKVQLIFLPQIRMINNVPPFLFPDSSLDELSEDSAIHCMQNEV